MTKSKYSVSRVTLYLILRMIATNLRDKQTDFHDFKAFYTLLYITAFDNAISATELLPTEAQRDALAKEEHLALAPLAEISRFNFKDLERYAASTWTDPATFEAKMIVAGKHYYTGASHDNWSDCKEMNRLANQFTIDNATALEAGMNMPTSFLAKILLGKTNFADKYSSFVTEESAKGIKQTTKMDAENDLWKQATKIICPDGIAIARHDEDFSDLFTIEEIKQLVALGGGSGLKGDVLTGVASMPLETVTVHIVELDVTFETEIHGKFRSPSIAHGTYTVTFTKPGYVTVTKTGVIINVHAFKTLHIIMVPTP